MEMEMEMTIQSTKYRCKVQDEIATTHLTILRQLHINDSLRIHSRNRENVDHAKVHQVSSPIGFDSTYAIDCICSYH